MNPRWRTRARFLLVVGAMCGAICSRAGGTPQSQAVRQPGADVPEAYRSWGETIGGLQLSVAFLPGEVIIGQPVDLDLGIWNASAHTVTFSWYDFPTPEFHFMVRDAHGVVVPMTRYGRMACTPYVSHGFFEHNTPITILPRHEYQVHLWLNRMFDMSLVGDYTVTATTMIPSPGGMVTGADKMESRQVVSNTADVLVLDHGI